MDPDYLDEDLRGLGKHIAPVSLNFLAQRELARLFSRVVDAKSPYTEQHSERVSLVARQLAKDFDITGQDLEQVEIAGLLHDIGKLRVSEDIIDKPGKLTADERACMQRHSYDTYRILQRVFADTRIPVWAGFHHENLRGEGHPVQTQGSERIECRIISVADVFQALRKPARTEQHVSQRYPGGPDRRVANNEIDGTVLTVENQCRGVLRWQKLKSERGNESGDPCLKTPGHTMRDKPASQNPKSRTHGNDIRCI